MKPSRAKKIKPGSATQRMRAECDDLVHVHEASSGIILSVPATYEKFPYTNVGCSNSGYFCWGDPLTKRRYTLQSQDLQELGRRGIMTHECVPKELRDILRKRWSSHRKRKAEALGVQAVAVA
jgi:hypothetical protein